MSGYQIKPLGWVVLLVLVGLTVYLVVRWVHRHKKSR